MAEPERSATYAAGPDSGGAATQRMARPRQVKVAAILMAVLGVIGLLLAWLVLALLRNNESHGRTIAEGYFILAYLQFVLSGLQTVSGLLLWRGSRLGRVLAITLCVINVLGAIGTLASGAVAQAVFAAGLNIALIRMLADEEVGYWVE